MKLVICGSMSFAKEMKETQVLLEAQGHTVFVPRNLNDFLNGTPAREKKELKIQHDVFKDYFNKIRNSDGVLVLNGMTTLFPGYIGVNALIEMAFAYVQNKKIFLLNQIPEMDYSDEIEALTPTILNGDLSSLT